MSQPSPTYEPRMPSQGVVYQVVRDHFESFRAQAAGLRDGAGLPRFVEQEFREDKVPDPGRCHACGEPCRTARQEGFDLDAGVRVPAGQRDRLERLCRCALRPTVAQDRLRVTAEGQVVLQLRHPWADGTTHLLFDPLELLERLAVLIPRPRINLILYHGILGPRAAWRSLVVGFGNTTDCGEASTIAPSPPTAHVDPREVSTTDSSTAAGHVDRGEARATEPAPDPPCGREGRPPREEARCWADLMRRTFDRPTNCSSRRAGDRGDPDHTSVQFRWILV